MEFEVTAIDIADLDCVFLTYDEPNKEENWVKIKNMVPWARRVDGVKGSDAAHKAAADASDTDRFVLVDGDNIPDPEFFNLQLKLNHDENCVFRWRARNHINGLMYGNGGLSVWSKQFVYNMRTHEASDGSTENDVEFCFYPNYYAMHDCYSTTYPNASAFQAWRAGFREGVKMCLEQIEGGLVDRLHPHVDMLDAGLTIFRQQVLVSQNVIHAGFEENAGPQVALDQQVEDGVPALPVKGRDFIGDHGHVHTIAIAQHLQLVHKANG